MTIIIKVDTGFVGATHEKETEFSRKEWEELSSREINEYITEVVWDHIDAYAVDEDDPDTPL